MRADELMIGDLVSLFQGNCDYSPCNCKVNSISEYEIGIDGCDEYDYATLPLIFPIPITPEILEKNGFKYNPFSSGFWECKTEDGNISCTKLDYWLFYINDYIIPNHFNYVHELQHALRLCGIIKNIVL